MERFKKYSYWGKTETPKTYYGFFFIWKNFPNCTFFRRQNVESVRFEANNLFGRYDFEFRWVINLWKNLGPVVLLVHELPWLRFFLNLQSKYKVLAQPAKRIFEKSFFFIFFTFPWKRTLVFMNVADESLKQRLKKIMPSSCYLDVVPVYCILKMRPKFVLAFVANQFTVTSPHLMNGAYI